MDFSVPTTDSHPWNSDYVPPTFDISLSTLEQANSIIEDIYNLYYSPSIVDYD